VNELIATVNIASWNPAMPADSAARFVDALEDGRIVYVPELRFALLPSEQRFLDPATLGDDAKSVAFDPVSGMLKHARADQAEIAAMMRRYADSARTLVCSLMPPYSTALEWGRTSFRPVGIQGRASSVAKDDTLLHIDAFPSSPVGDRRILRVFSNINPDGVPRHWRVGEPFAAVAERFYPTIRRPSRARGRIMQALRLTRGYRTAYDQAMLELHDRMKHAPAYQQTVSCIDVDFAAGSTWIAFTDAVSHAALSGQHLFEQTFYVPVSAMADESKSPLRVLEALARRRLAPRRKAAA
jgi:3-deoxy-D-manno-oct-2-ulosonic acid (Kdo) hydroxylase